jgi:hypothetical protein
LTAPAVGEKVHFISVASERGDGSLLLGPRPVRVRAGLNLVGNELIGDRIGSEMGDASLYGWFIFMPLSVLPTRNTQNENPTYPVKPLK